jgi:hypothetical protein
MRIKNEIFGDYRMSTTIEATFDGAVFRPSVPVSLAPNTHVRLTVQPIPTTPANPSSFLRTARSMKLEGPPDWATNLEKYLYGEEAEGEA